MKSVIKVLSCAVILFLVFTLGTGCHSTTQAVYTADTIAVVNGEAVTAQSLQDETIKREIAAKMLQKMQELDSTIQSPAAGILQALGITASELSEDQKRYIASLERDYPDKPISPNYIFNQQVRQEVLYQEAVKQGYTSSTEEAQRILKQANDASAQAGSSDPAFQKIREESQAVYKEYGFASEDDYLKWNLPAAARSIAIQRLHNKFEEKIEAQHSELSDLPLIITQYNAWEDYTEFLLKNSVIEIKQADYELAYYGKPWEAGRLDLQE